MLCDRGRWSSAQRPVRLLAHIFIVHGNTSARPSFLICTSFIVTFLDLIADAPTSVAAANSHTFGASLAFLDFCIMSSSNDNAAAPMPASAAASSHPATAHSSLTPEEQAAARVKLASMRTEMHALQGEMVQLKQQLQNMGADFQADVQRTIAEALQAVTAAQQQHAPTGTTAADSTSAKQLQAPH